MHPFALAKLAAAGRTVFAVSTSGRDAEDLAALGSLLTPHQVAVYPGWAAARATVAPGGHGGPTAGRPPPARASARRRPGHRPAQRRRRARPSAAAAAGSGARRAGAGVAAGRRWRARAGRHRRRPRRGRLHPHRAGRASPRLGGAWRHPRRLPVHRGQLCGRVGRACERGYAHFLYPPSGRSSGCGSRRIGRSRRRRRTRRSTQSGRSWSIGTRRSRQRSRISLP